MLNEAKETTKRLLIYIEKQEKQERYIFKLKIIIFILGVSSIIAWFLQLLQVYWAIIKGGEYGIIHIAYNLYGEMYLEFIGFFTLFIILIFLTVYILKKRW